MVDADRQENVSFRSIRSQLDSICDEYDGQRAAGQRPDLADVLAKVEESSRPALALLLIEIDVEYRWREGEQPTVDNYDSLIVQDQHDQVQKIIDQIVGNQPAANERTVATKDGTKDGVADQPTQMPNKSGKPAGHRALKSMPDLDDYTLIEEIARGGMGVVYKARQKSLNRTVALKMILTGQLAGEEEISRFRSEAEAAAKLDHPGIVPIFEIGEHEGHQFFSMGFVEGQSLADRISAGPLPAKEAAQLVKKIAEAIAFAHQQGVIHRDLKPANVLIDSNGEPRVTDFGLAKKIEDDTGLTGTGQILGTPSFMPPEQASGETATIDERADVYALGAILYTLTTGRPPFQAATPLDTLLQVLDQEPVHPRRLDSKIPKDLETVCLKCLRKSKDKRYSDAKALAKDLDRIINGQPITARRVSRFERSWLWIRRNRITTAATLAFVFLLIVASIVSNVWRQKTISSKLVENLLNAETQNIDPVLNELKSYRNWADEYLEDAFKNNPHGSTQKLHAALALVFLNKPNQSILDYVAYAFLTISPDDMNHALFIFAPYKRDYVEAYWEVATDFSDPRAFQAACLLARLDAQNEKWSNPEFQSFVADQLVRALPSELKPFRNSLFTKKTELVPYLSKICNDEDAGEQVRSFASDTLCEYLADDDRALFELLVESAPGQFDNVFEKLSTARSSAVRFGLFELEKAKPADNSLATRIAFASRKANAAILLFRLDEVENDVWQLFCHVEGKDPLIRSYLIDRVLDYGAPSQSLIDRYKREKNASIKRAIVWCLGAFDKSTVSLASQTKFVDLLKKDFLEHPDAGLHSATEWLLRKLGEAKWVDSNFEMVVVTEDQLAQLFNLNEKRWFINGQRQTYTILAGGEFQMGSQKNEAGRGSEETIHRREIDRVFAIANTEVTVAQWRAFKKMSFADSTRLRRYSKTTDTPICAVTWYEAAEYCNWLSKQEGIPKDQWCYEPDVNNGFGPGMQAKSGFQRLTGYRLPTEAEWEFSCRAWANTSRFFGDDVKLLPTYAWYSANAQNKLHPVSQLKSNDFGLFGVYGNVSEWCHDTAKFYYGGENAVIDDQHVTQINDDQLFVLRGGAFFNHHEDIRSAQRSNDRPSFRSYYYGFRPARTIKSVR